jgi:hypothetical protein
VDALPGAHEKRLVVDAAEGARGVERLAIPEGLERRVARAAALRAVGSGRGRLPRGARRSARRGRSLPPLPLERVEPPPQLVDLAAKVVLGPLVRERRDGCGRERNGER